MATGYEGGFTRRQELTCTETEMAAYADVVLYENEHIYIKMNSGMIRLKIGDGKTGLLNLPWAKVFDATLDDVEAIVGGFASRVETNTKRIENLEAAVSPSLVTPTVDSTVAYTKTVPKGAMPNAAVCEIGGMSYKCENLIPFPYAFESNTTSGVTCTINSDGGVSYNGTSTTQLNPYFTSNLLLPKGIYTLSGAPSGASWDKYILIAQTADYSTILAEDYGSGTTFTLEADTAVRICLIIARGVTVSNLTVYPMLNKGETALPYQPYFTGLRDSKVTMIESVGRNIFGGLALANKIKEVAPSSTLNEQNKTIEYYSYEVREKKLFKGFKPNTQYTFILKGKSAEEFPNLGVAYTDGTFVTIPSFTTANTVETIRLVSNGSKSIASFDGNWSSGTTTLYYEECGIFEGSVLTEDFSPYFRETLPIPGDALDGWGQGVNAQYCNKIVLDPAEGVMKYRQICAKRGYLAGDETRADVLTDGKNETVYILKNPVETDVSAYFTEDNLLRVVPGGTITAANEFEHEVPFTVEYMIKGA